MAEASGRLRFGAFEFDRATGELFQAGRRVRFQRQPSRLLDLLLTRPGQLVTREEIRKALWGDDTFVDFERSLNFCVGKLRSALRDNAAAPTYVETVPTRGYRFVALVEPVAAAGPAASSTVSVADTPQQAGPQLNGRVAVLAAGLAVGAIIALRMFVTVPAMSTPRVVVVPFHNETGVADLDWVAKGVSDAAVARLAESDRLRVIGNATGVAFTFKPPDMRAMGESLGAQFLVLGQLKRDDRQLRVVAHLIRVSDQTHVWAHTYDRPTLDLDAQSAVAGEIAKAVVKRLAP